MGLDRPVHRAAGQLARGGAQRALEQEDLVQDGWTDLARRIRGRISSLPFYKMTPKNMMAAFEDLDHEKMTEIRERVDTIVEDEATAQKSKFKV